MPTLETIHALIQRYENITGRCFNDRLKYYQDERIMTDPAALADVLSWFIHDSIRVVTSGDEMPDGITDPPEYVKRLTQLLLDLRAAMKEPEESCEYSVTVAVTLTKTVQVKAPDIGEAMKAGQETVERFLLGYPAPFACNDYGFAITSVIPTETMMVTAPPEETPQEGSVPTYVPTLDDLVSMARFHFANSRALRDAFPNETRRFANARVGSDRVIQLMLEDGDDPVWLAEQIVARSTRKK